MIAALAIILLRPIGPTPEGPDASSDHQMPSALWIGDSYSAGVGAPSVDEGWAGLVAQRLDWSLTNLALGGTGYVATSSGPGCGRDEQCPNFADVVTDVAPADGVDIVVVAGGRNDINADTGELDTAVDAFYATLRARYPDAVLIATNPLWDSGAPPPHIARLTGVVAAAARAHDVHFVDLGQPLSGRSDLVAADGVHPTSRGHVALADVAEPLFASLTLPG